MCPPRGLQDLGRQGARAPYRSVSTGTQDQGTAAFPTSWVVSLFYLSPVRVSIMSSALGYCPKS